MTLLLIVAAGTSVSAQTVAGDSLKMDSLVRSLPEVMIKGERPMVKVKGAALVYDIDRITEGSPVDNAYDALKEIPGVVETGGSLTLGGREVTVIIDGRVTNMTQEQTAQLLKSMSKDRLKDVEVMYNAPARYQVSVQSGDHSCGGACGPGHGRARLCGSERPGRACFRSSRRKNVPGHEGLGGDIWHIKKG